jgi:uncharacterized protein (UPF0303 family)
LRRWVDPAVGLPARVRVRTRLRRVRSDEEASRLDPNTYAAHGALSRSPLGTGVIGTVAVSGLPQAEVHDLAVAALEEHLSR